MCHIVSLLSRPGQSGILFVMWPRHFNQSNIALVTRNKETLLPTRHHGLVLTEPMSRVAGIITHHDIMWQWLSHPLLKGCVMCADVRRSPARAQHWLSGLWWMLITAHRWRHTASSSHHQLCICLQYQKSLYLSRPNWFVGYGHSVWPGQPRRGGELYLLAMGFRNRMYNIAYSRFLIIVSLFIRASSRNGFFTECRGKLASLCVRRSCVTLPCARPLWDIFVRSIYTKIWNDNLFIEIDERRSLADPLCCF